MPSPRSAQTAPPAPRSRRPHATRRLAATRGPSRWATGLTSRSAARGWPSRVSTRPRRLTPARPRTPSRLAHRRSQGAVIRLPAYGFLRATSGADALRDKPAETARSARAASARSRTAIRVASAPQRRHRAVRALSSNAVPDSCAAVGAVTVSASSGRRATATSSRAEWTRRASAERASRLPRWATAAGRPRRPRAASRARRTATQRRASAWLRRSSRQAGSAHTSRSRSCAAALHGALEAAVREPASPTRRTASRAP